MISVISTAHNERDSIALLYKKIKESLKDLKYEFIFVDDGSTDGTQDEIKRIKDEKVKVIKFDERKGQCLALHRGIMTSRGDIIATIDADLQNDPVDIPLMLKELRKGQDLVCGWRYDRKDSGRKILFSRIGNLAQNLLFGMNLHDSNCPVKVFKKECLAGYKYFRNYHRFISALVHLRGYKIKEYRVRHYPRLYGISRHGFRDRFWSNIKTFLVIKFRYKSFLRDYLSEKA